jgi:hypothetical protein
MLDPARRAHATDCGGTPSPVELPRMLKVRYAGFLKAVAGERLLPDEFTNLLTAIRDGSFMPMLDDPDVTAPIPVAEPERAREIALLLAMLMGLRQTGANPELEFRVHGRILHLVETADATHAVTRRETATQPRLGLQISYN